MNIYTNGQRLRGRAIFAAGGPRAAFIDNYFRVRTSNDPIYCTGRIRLFNPTCLQTTWSIVSGNATLTNPTNDQVTINSTTAGSVVVRAVAGNYVSEATFTIDVSNPITGQFMLSGQRFNYGANGPGNSFSVCPNEALTFVPTYIGNSMWTDLGIIAHEWTISGNYSFSSSLNQEFLSVMSASTHPNAFQFTYRYQNACGWSQLYYGSAGTMNCDGGEEPFRVGGGDLDFTVSPNPAKNDVTISTIGVNSSFEVRIFELLTSKQHKYLRFEKTQKQIRLNIADLKVGTYIVQITANGKIKTKQLQIIR